MLSGISNQNDNSPSYSTDNGYSKKIIITNKGESSYFSAMDLDKDGIVTLEEFNRYCEENSISDEDKLKLFEVMQLSKTTDKMTQSSEEKEQSQRIYAKKGDKKYVEEMDEDKNSIVTYEEYIKYCEKAASKKSETSNENQSSEMKKAVEAYSKEEEVQDISVDSEA